MGTPGSWAKSLPRSQGAGPEETTGAPLPVPIAHCNILAPETPPYLASLVTSRCPSTDARWAEGRPLAPLTWLLRTLLGACLGCPWTLKLQVPHIHRFQCSFSPGHSGGNLKSWTSVTGLQSHQE